MTKDCQEAKAEAGTEAGTEAEAKARTERTKNEKDHLAVRSVRRMLAGSVPVLGKSLALTIAMVSVLFEAARRADVLGWEGRGDAAWNGTHLSNASSLSSIPRPIWVTSMRIRGIILGIRGVIGC